MDSSVLIAAEQKKLDWNAFVRSFSDEPLFVSSITLSELWHGYHRGKGLALPQRLAFIRQIEAAIPTLGFAAEEARIHAKIWAKLEEAGQTISPHDFIIAATALAYEYALATLNESEFRRIPDLKVISGHQFLLK